MDFSQFVNKSTQEVLDDLKTSMHGLPKKEAALRQQKYGLNEVKPKGNNILDILLRQFKSPFFYLIAGAAVISFLVGQRIDGAVITVTASINILISFFQEYRAERAVFLLRKFIPQQVKVLRTVGAGSSEQEIIEKKNLVPGDVVVLESGDIVPADLRVLELESFLIDESILTGESVPVGKTDSKITAPVKEVLNAQNLLFTGSSVVSGKAKGVVVAIGNDTAFGEIAKLVSVTSRQSAYEKNIIYFCRLVLRIVLVTISFMFLVNLFLKGPGDFFNLLLFSVALIVSILPEALPAVITFALSKGSMQMAKHHVVVRRLSAIEDLGNIEILCSDKTGTLTENKLSLEKIVSSDQKKCLAYGIVQNQANQNNKKILNPFDAALLERTSKEALAKTQKWKLLAELPFDSFRMRSSYLAQISKNERILIVKGAPEVVVKLCSKFSGTYRKEEIAEDTQREGQNGKRILAVAFKKIESSADIQKISEKDEKQLTFLGYFVFEDPLKSTAEEAIRLSKKLGVQIKIITGDSKEVAGYVAKKTGLVSSSLQVVLGEDLEKMSRDDFDAACEESAVFARISPKTKYNIIRSLQKKYEVGFMGEGINDAPALKIANVAIAVPSASDISREVSDVVMLKKDLRVLVEGIREGRAIFSNINKYIKCMLSSNFGNFYSVAVISLFINYLPMLPVQILLVNLLSDFPIISIATDSVDVEELRKPKMYQLHMVLPLIISLALVSTVFDFIFFMIFKSAQPASIQTLWFVESILTELVLIYIIRTRHVFWKARKPGFWLLLFSITDAIFVVTLPFLPFGHTLFHFVQPSLIGLLVVFLLVIIYFAASEVVKLVYFHYFKLSKNNVSIDKLR